MNSKITKIGVFTLGLLALGLLLTNKTGTVNAGNLDLDISGGTLTCTLSSGLDLTYVTASFNTQVKSGSLGAFQCVDLQGTQWLNGVTIASDDLADAGSDTITGIYFEMGSTTVTSGSCTADSGAANTYTNINTENGGGAAALIFDKTQDNAVCRLDVASSDIKVNIPASQPVASYQSTLTVTFPS